MKKMLVMLLCVLLAGLPMANALAFSMPAALTTIESEAFEGDRSIGGTISLPSKVRSVGYEAFKDTDIFGLWMPSTIREIGSDVLAGTDAMYVVVPATDVDMPDAALSGARYVITLQDSTVHGQATANGSECYFTGDIVWHNNFCYTYNPDVDGMLLLFARTDSISGSVTIPESVNGKRVYDVSPHAFTRLDGVTEINVPDTATLPGDPENWPDAPVNVYATGVEPEIPEGAQELAMDPARLTMNPGDDYGLWLSEGQDIPEILEMVWSSSDGNVVAAGENGYIEAVGLGKAAVTVTLDCGEAGMFYAVCQIEVVEPAVEITIYNDPMELAVGKMDAASYSLSVSGLEGNVEISFESSDPETVYCESPYYFKGLKPGTATVTYTATLHGVTDTATVEVNVVEPELQLNHMSLYGYTTFDYQLEVVSELPEGATVAWTSEDENIAVVDDNGLVAMVGEGDTYIICTVTYADGSEASIDCDLHAIDWHMAWEQVDAPYEMFVGDHYTCRPILEQYFWSWEIDESIRTFTVSDESIVTFDENNDAIAHAPGLVRVHAHAEFRGREAESDFYILVHSDEQPSIPMDRSSVTMNAGDEVWVWPVHEVGEWENFTWSSSDENVATFDENRITAVGLGSATVTMTMTDEDGIVYYSRCLVEVVEPYVSISLHEDEVFIPVGRELNVGFDYDFHGMEENLEITIAPEDISIVGEDLKGASAGTTTVTYTVSLNGASASDTVKVVVYEPALHLNDLDLYTIVGITEQLEILTGLPEDAVVEWESTDENVFTIDDTGLITVVGEGEAVAYCTVTYADGSRVMADCNVYAFEPTLEWEEPSDPYYMKVGRVERTHPGLWYTHTPDHQEVPELTLSSSDENVVTFDEDNNTVAVGVGEAVVTAVGSQYGRTVECSYTVIVEEPYLSVTIYNGDFDIWQLDEYHQVDYSCERDVEIDRIRLTSSDESVLTVDAGGKITPVGYGTATITVTVIAGDYSASDSINVTVRPRTASIAPSAPTLDVGESIQLVPEIELAEGEHLVNFWFNSTNEDVAYVSSEGMLTGLSAGSAVITFGGEIAVGTEIVSVSATTVVTVENAESPVQLSESSIDLKLYNSYQLTAEFASTPESVTWTSSDPDYTPVDGNGVVSVERVHHENNPAVITCTAVIGGVEYSDSCLVFARSGDMTIRHLPGMYYMGVGETWTASYEVSAVGLVPYTIEWETEDESIATVDENGNVTAVSEGVTKLWLHLYAGANNTPVCSASSVVLVGSDVPAPETFEFLRGDVLMVETAAGHNFGYADVNIQPEWLAETLDFTLTSSDESVVTTNGLEFYGQNAGKATLTVSSRQFPELTDTMTVYVFDFDISISDTELEVGETLTISLNNVPEDFEYEYLWCDYDYELFSEVIRTDSSITLRARQTGDTTIRYGANSDRYGVSSEDFESAITITGDSTYMLSETDIWMNVGEYAYIGPDFYAEDIVWTSNNTDVVVVEDGYKFIAVGLGECELTMTFTAEDGSTQTVNAWAHVVEPEWTLYDIRVPSVIEVDSYHGPGIDFETSGCNHPDCEWSISDETVAEFANNGYDIHALKPGTFTLTVVATKDGRSETLSKQITVIEPAVRMENTYISLRPGQTETLNLIAADGVEIGSVEWKSMDASIATVDQSTGAVTLLSADGPVMIVANVTFTDGSTASAICWVESISDDDIYVNAWTENDYFELEKSGETGYAYIEIDTNAAAEEIAITWQVADDTIVSVTPEGYYNIPDACALIQPLAAGETEITARVQVGENGSIYDQTFTFRVNVYEKYFSIEPTEIAITMNVGDTRGVNWNAQWDRINVTRIEDSSADTGIVRMAKDDQIVALRPGSTTVTRTYYDESGAMLGSASIDVTVSGPEITLSMPLSFLEYDSATNYTCQLTANVEANGCTLYGYGWESSNPEVVLVGNDGTIVGLTYGDSTITYWQDTDYGQYSASIRVHVDGTVPQINMNRSLAELYYGQSVQLAPVHIDGLTPDSTYWYVEGGGDCITVDQNGLVRMENYHPIDRVATVYCAATYGDETLTAVSHVTAKTPTAGIIGWMFNEDTCLNMHTGDKNPLWEALWNSNGSIEDLTVTYTIDDPSVAAFYTEDGITGIEAIGSGETTAHITIVVDETAEFVESYTYDLLVRVDQPSVVIESVTPRAGTIVMEAGWDRMRHVELEITPSYANRDFRYVSGNTDVVIVDEYGGELLGGTPGRATVDITVVENTDLNTSVEVLVLDEVTFGPADGHTVLKPGEVVQLAFNGANWTDDEVESIWYDVNGNLTVDENGLLHVKADQGEASVYAHVRFRCGYEVGYSYSCTIDSETPYVFTQVGDGYSELNGYPTLVTWMGVMHNCAEEDVKSITHASSNDAVAYVDEDSNIHCVSLGDAVITTTLTLTDGTALTFELPVNVSETQAPVIECNPESRVIYAGDTVNTYIDWSGCAFTVCPEHYYVSGDTGVLVVNGSTENNEHWSITGVAPGKATLTAVTNYGDMTTEHSVTVYVVAKPDTPASDFTYEIADDEVAITAYNGTETGISVPAEIDGYPVTSVSLSYNTTIENVVLPESVTAIGASAFESCVNLRTVNIPASVASIGQYAFSNCLALASLNIPAGVTEIGTAFASGCTALTEISVDAGNASYVSQDGVLFDKDMTTLIQCPGGRTDSCVIPDGVTAIGEGAFAYCTALPDVSIPDSVTTIGPNAFCGCFELTGITLPEGLTTIGQGAFDSCVKLASLEIPASVTSIGENFALACEALTEITVSADNASYASQDGVLFSKDMTELIKYPIGKDGSAYSVPAGVTTIARSAFNSCVNLTEVVLPDGLETIGVRSFYICTGLASVNIPESVTFIGNRAFGRCTSLTGVTVPAGVTTIEESAFSGHESLLLYVYENSPAHTWCEESGVAYEFVTDAAAADYTYEIANGEAAITAYNGAETDITIPSAIDACPVTSVSIRNNAAITSIVLPDSMTVLGDYAFEGCTALEKVVLPAGITSIGSYCFNQCAALTEISLAN